jgi:hypothetical protein
VRTASLFLIGCGNTILAKIFRVRAITSRRSLLRRAGRKCLAGWSSAIITVPTFDEALYAVEKLAMAAKTVRRFCGMIMTLILGNIYHNLLQRLRRATSLGSASTDELFVDQRSPGLLTAVFALLAGRLGDGLTLPILAAHREQRGVGLGARLTGDKEHSCDKKNGQHASKCLHAARIDRATGQLKGSSDRQGFNLSSIGGSPAQPEQARETGILGGSGCGKGMEI